jgi:hypothetical protein
MLDIIIESSKDPYVFGACLITFLDLTINTLLGRFIEGILMRTISRRDYGQFAINGRQVCTERARSRFHKRETNFFRMFSVDVCIAAVDPNSGTGKFQEIL